MRRIGRATPRGSGALRAGRALALVIAAALAVPLTACTSEPSPGPTTSSPATGPATSIPTTRFTSPATTAPSPGVTPTLEPDRVIQVGQAPTGLVWIIGAMWVTDPPAGDLLRVDGQTGDVLERIHLGGSPQALSYHFRSLWVSNRASGEVTRINPATGKIVATIDVGGGSELLDPTPDGMWASAGEDVVRIDASTNEVVQRIHVGGQIESFIVRFGSVWATIFEDSHVLRFSVANGEARRPIPLGDGAGGLTAQGGRLWGAASTDTALHAFWPPSKRTKFDLGVGAAPFVMTTIGSHIFAGDRFASRVYEVNPDRDVEYVREVPAPVATVVRGAGGQWATSPDAGSVALLGLH